MDFAGPVIIFTPGRVGTRTVSNSLRQAGVAAVQVHRIGPALDAAIPQIRAQSPNPAAKIDRALEVEKQIRRARLLGTRVRVVTLIRDPIDRAVSMMFLLFAAGDLDRRCAADGVDAVADEMCGRFRAGLPDMLEDFRAWYAEVLPLAIETASPPFTPGRDYSIFSTLTAHCLLMPMERFARLDAALGQFIGQPIAASADGVSKAANQTAESLRRRLEQAVELTPAQLDTVYDQPIVRAVYDPETIDGFRRRWQA